MPKIVLYLLIFVPTLWLGILVAVYYFQESMIFNPEVLPVNHTFIFPEADFEERSYQVSDSVAVNALMFRTPHARKGVIYYHHGNAGSLQDWGERAEDFTRLGYDVLMYDYRSYGKSQGQIKSEKMIYRDAHFIYDALLEEYREQDIVVYGVSLGTGVACRIAADRFPRLLILETPYYNFYDVARFHYPYLPNSVLLKYRFNSNKYIKRCNVPVWSLHGTSDQTVPYANSEKLAEEFEHLTLITIPDGLHNNLRSYAAYHTALQDILK